MYRLGTKEYSTVHALIPLLVVAITFRLLTRTSMGPKSAFPTPTIRIDKGSDEAAMIDEMVLSKSLMIPSVCQCFREGEGVTASASVHQSGLQGHTQLTGRGSHAKGNPLVSVLDSGWAYNDQEDVVLLGLGGAMHCISGHPLDDLPPPPNITNTHYCIHCSSMPAMTSAHVRGSCFPHGDGGMADGLPTYLPTHLREEGGPG